MPTKELAKIVLPCHLKLGNEGFIMPPEMPPEVLHFLFALGGFLSGVVLMVASRAFGPELPPWTWALVAVGSLAVLGLAGAVARELSFVQAMLIIVLGSAALAAAAHAILMFAKGESIELQSNWGGLGGGLGGWRLSPTTGVLLMALAFGGGAIGVTVTGKDNPDDKKIKNVAAEAQSKEVKKTAPATPPEAQSGTPKQTPEASPPKQQDKQ